MRKIDFTDDEIRDIVNDYQNGMGVYDICDKYHLGKIRLKDILSNNDVILRKRGKRPMHKSDFKLADWRCKKYINNDDYHYIVIDKNNDGFISNDIYNNAGVLTKYIEKQYNVIVPSLYERRKYYMKHGDYWWEKWLTYKRVKNDDTIRCPYCEWETIDMKNRSGMFETHLRTAHGIDKYNFIENFPEYREYFSQIKDPVSLRQFENDTDKFVTCKICGKKLSRIGTRHLSTHGITKEQYIALYGISDMISKEFYNKSIKCVRFLLLCN